MRWNFNENGIYLTLEKNEEDGTLRLLHFGAEPFKESDILSGTKEGFRLVEVNVPGYDRPYERMGNKYIVTAPGYKMQFVSHNDSRNENGRLLEFVSFDEETGIRVTTHMQIFDGVSVMQIWNTAENAGTKPQTLDMISTFTYTGVEKEGISPWQEKWNCESPSTAGSRN